MASTAPRNMIIVCIDNGLHGAARGQTGHIAHRTDLANMEEATGLPLGVTALRTQRAGRRGAVSGRIHCTAPLASQNAAAHARRLEVQLNVRQLPAAIRQSPSRTAGRLRRVMAFCRSALGLGV